MRASAYIATSLSLRRGTAELTMRAEAYVALDQFVATCSAKYLKAVEKLTKDREELLAFYDFPAGHWQHKSD